MRYKNEVTLDSYNPNNAVNNVNWLALDETIKIKLVQDFHLDLALDLSDDALKVHSLIHVIVENQLTTGVGVANETVEKLMRQGLERHESIHAIGAIISEDIFNVMKGDSIEFSFKKYRRKLEKLTAKRWLKGQY